MNLGIRRVGIAVIALLLVLVAQLTWLQVIDANKLDRDPRNLRSVLRDINRARGEILTSDGEVLARSVKVSDGTEFTYQREYPLGALTAQTVGYQSFVVGNVGVERSYNDVLSGRDPELRSLSDVLRAKETTGTVVLSLRASVQRAAAEALGDQRGSVVVLDVRTGGIVALYSNPTYDPQPLAGHDTRAVSDYYRALSADPARPDLPRAYREIYPPGSTFKVVTSAVAFDAGVATPTTVYPTLTELKLPLSSNTLRNFGGGTCGGTVFEAFVVSCNVTFAQMGLDLGDRFQAGLDRFGIGPEAPPLDLDPGAVRSSGVEGLTMRSDAPQFAYAGIGQGPISTTPLEMALVAEAVATGGVILEPHVGAEIRDADGRTVTKVAPTPWRTAMTPTTAQALSAMMRAVVERGTGTRAQLPGVAVAGKTGTAQHDGGQPHAWFVGFAPAEAPRFAVAVIVESGGSFGSEATGGSVSAPIAGRVLAAALAP